MPSAVHQYALIFFSLFAALSLGITLHARKHNRSAAAFYTADRRIGSWQNGLALAGDYLSAAALLGGIGLYLTHGYDSLFYAVATLLGWPLLLLLLAEKLRAEGCYTVGDIVRRRFGSRRIRLLTAGNTLAVSSSYLIVQMVGAGKLIELLFGLPYLPAVLLTATLTMLYVTVGGMLATSRVQMVKALLMLGCGIYLTYAVLQNADFSLSRLTITAITTHPDGTAIMLPSPLLRDPLEVCSLALGLTLGLLGLPHVLMRFFTVADVRAARISACCATGIIALFFTLNALIGLGAIALLGTPTAGGGNMALIHLSRILGGDWLAGLVAAVAFAAILAVMAGLTLAGASAIGHDLYANLFSGEQTSQHTELRLSRGAAIALTATAAGVSVIFQQQNIAFLLGLAFAIAAAANFPLLFLTLYWPSLTERGAFACGATGLVGSIICIGLGPSVWIPLGGFEQALIPYANPALFTVLAAFFAAWLFSLIQRNQME